MHASGNLGRGRGRGQGRAQSRGKASSEGSKGRKSRTQEQPVAKSRRALETVTNRHGGGDGGGGGGGESAAGVDDGACVGNGSDNSSTKFRTEQTTSNPG